MATPFRTESKDKSSRKTQFVIIICSAIFLLIFYFWIVPLNSSSIVWLQGVNFSLNQGLRGSEENNQQPTYNKLLDGLLSPNFDEQSCQSRYQSSAHRKRSQHKPSEYLVSVLRNYEALHQRCGPNSELYRKAISGLKSGHSTSSMECNYLVWSPYHGLGNRMLTIASAFLYALLTKRVLLLHITDDMVDLFCEPFPGTTWVLPSDHFSIKDLEQFNVSSEQSYGNYLKNNSIRTDIKVMTLESLPAYVYLHLEHDYEHLDRLFFCDNDQQVLAKVNWLLIKSDMYFVPGLFFLSQFEDELRAMFPERETVFHHLSRYLYHPTNSVWGMIMRYYSSYMANADEKIGIQVRTFWYLPISAENLTNQVIACSWRENILPSINEGISTLHDMKRAGRMKSVLVTSLNSEHYEKMMSLYYEHAASTGDIIRFSQPSHEKEQQTEKQRHNQKALTGIFLLSYCDVMVTTARSTFGYIAQGVAGLKLWILLSPENEKAPDPPCRRAVSMEPCFHYPPSYDCKANKNVDFGAVSRIVKHCEDIESGIKLVGYAD